MILRKLLPLILLLPLFASAAEERMLERLYTFSGSLANHLRIVHGMVDDNVLFQDAVQLAEELIQEGKDFGQTYYPQESHGFVRDETRIDACRRTVEWFERYLK